MRLTKNSARRTLVAGSVTPALCPFGCLLRRSAPGIRRVVGVTRCPQSTPGYVHALCPADDAKKPQQISLYGVKATAYEGTVLEDGSNLPAKASDQSENR